MKKILIILFVLIFIIISAEDIFIKKDDGLYKITIDENGDTLSIEKISVIDDTKDEEKLDEEIIIDKVFDDDPQWLKAIVPYEWQVGVYSFSRGLFYGFTLAASFIPDISLKPELTIFSSMAMPLGMLLAPPLLLGDSVSPISIPIIDMGYYLGPLDYFAMRFFIAPSISTNQYDPGFSVLTGIAESWGGYFLLQNIGDFRRAAGHFYNAGAFTGYLWGGLQGLYIASKINSSDSNTSIRIGIGTALAYSLGLRSLGFWAGNNKDLNYRALDVWIPACNTFIGMLIMGDVIIQTEMDSEEILLLLSLGGMASTAATAYIMKDTHFDDFNAMLTILGGILGGSLGSGISALLYPATNEVYLSLTAIGIVAGELAIYQLRKNTIGADIKTPTNIGFNFFPTEHNGMGVNLSFNF
ncbi:hypothetical protein KAU15_04060 [candidate division WOR-3 bacterium]|nr:hypothetical protein [candidate division WOR-3 bacterium]